MSKSQRDAERARRKAVVDQKRRENARLKAQREAERARKKQCEADRLKKRQEALAGKLARERKRSIKKPEDTQRRTSNGRKFVQNSKTGKVTIYKQK